MRVTLKKLEERPDATHPNNIEVGFIKEGDFIKDPVIGEPFWVGNYWRTSTVKEILSPTTFKTHNSIYEYTVD